MKAEITIFKCSFGWYCDIKIQHAFLEGYQTVTSRIHKSKGEVKRKAIQFCSDLNLEYEMVGEK